MARPNVVIDYILLDKLCKMQCTGEECASLLPNSDDSTGIDYDTLDRNLKKDGHVGFAEYFKKKSSSGKASLRRVQFKNALDGSVPMQIWLGKQYLNQRDQNQIDLSSSDKSMSPRNFNDFYNDEEEE